MAKNDATKKGMPPIQQQPPPKDAEPEPMPAEATKPPEQTPPPDEPKPADEAKKDTESEQPEATKPPEQTPPPDEAKKDVVPEPKTDVPEKAEPQVQIVREKTNLTPLWTFLVLIGLAALAALILGAYSCNNSASAVDKTAKLEKKVDDGFAGLEKRLGTKIDNLKTETVGPNPTQCKECKECPPPCPPANVDENKDKATSSTPPAKSSTASRSKSNGKKVVVDTSLAGHVKRLEERMDTAEKTIAEHTNMLKDHKERLEKADKKWEALRVRGLVK